MSSRKWGVIMAALTLTLSVSESAGTAHVRGFAHVGGFGGGEPPAFRDGPPARVTGGFGEDSCFACHWDGAENDGVGSLRVAGFPEEYEPGEKYDLEIVLSHPELVVGGFQLAVRASGGEDPAGALEARGPHQDRVSILVDRGVEFAQHTLEGIESTGERETRWLLHWTAPGKDGVTAFLHLSAVAGDGDESQMGDAVYTRALESRPRDSGSLPALTSHPPPIPR